MSSQYKENNFSTENYPTSLTLNKNMENKITRPNIDHLIKRILIRKRQERKNIICLGVFIFSTISIFYFFQG